MRAAAFMHCESLPPAGAAAALVCSPTTCRPEPCDQARTKRKKTNRFRTRDYFNIPLADLPTESAGTQALRAATHAAVYAIQTLGADARTIDRFLDYGIPGGTGDGDQRVQVMTANTADVASNTDQTTRTHDTIQTIGAHI